MRNRMYDALPPMLGGKRKMLDIISSHFQGQTFCDIFSGGGSVSLKAKSMGMKLISNDIAYRSRVITESLIKNQREKITDEDIYSLFLPVENDHFVEKTFVPEIFTPELAKVIDTALENARKRESPKREMLELCIIKLIMSTRQFGGFQVGREDNKMIIQGKETELIEMASEARAKKIINVLEHPLSNLLRIKEQINQAVFNNLQKNEVYQMDCFDLLEKLRHEKRKIDTIYFDSPYKSSTIYSEHYKVLDQILAGRMDVAIDDKAFNRKDALENFEKLFSLSEFIPQWIISMGYNPKNDGGIKGEQLLAVVRKFRPARLYHLDHIWAISNIASKTGKKQEENVEYLIVTN